MVVEWMSGRTVVAGANSKGSIMETSGALEAPLQVLQFLQLVIEISL